MSSALNAAYNILPMLNRSELRLLQAEIAKQLHTNDDTRELFRPLSEIELAAELDAAIADFDAGNGYSAEQMCQSVRRRFGWTQP